MSEQHTHNELLKVKQHLTARSTQLGRLLNAILGHTWGAGDDTVADATERAIVQVQAWRGAQGDTGEDG